MKILFKFYHSIHLSTTNEVIKQKSIHIHNTLQTGFPMSFSLYSASKTCTGKAFARTDAVQRQLVRGAIVFLIKKDIQTSVFLSEIIAEGL